LKKGTLFLIPSSLGETPIQEILPKIAQKVIGELKYFIVENEKSARRFIKSVNPGVNQEELNIFQLDKHNKAAFLQEFIEPLLQSKDMGLLSEAGLPAIADPGSLVVSLAHKNNIPVKPLVGPSSLMLALMASGLNGQNFSFEGYLAKDNSELKHQIKHLEKHSLKNNSTKICIETPYRNNKLFESLLKNLHSDTKLCVACDLTLSTEFIKTIPVRLWRKQKPDLHKRLCVFLFQA